ncbi:MAG: hypothetical protein CL843_09405 [Crocinitomicaceae bacterium]|nr:hypothetical protein [Crocinitomicaceae bacterium]|tara:strand:+ start:2381 stop:4747 length:2367 start_codon:yes stop_codon:yes gene_type:complete
MALFPDIDTSNLNSRSSNKSKNTEEVANIVSSGRSSIPDYPTLGSVSNKIEITPEFNINILETMEYLAVTNGSFTQALDNIVQLGNTDHEIEFSNNASDSIQREIIDILDEAENRWYEFAEGNQSLKGDLLAQMVINGCLSAEFIPDKFALKRIENIVRVRPKNIRFVYNPDTTKHDPYQRLGFSSSEVNGLNKLNTLTYTYIALRRYFESPYPTPPFLASIRSLMIKDAMINNFETIMKMMGMFGIVSVEVKKPPKKISGESDEQYLDRCYQHLENRINPNVKKMLSSGFITGYKDDMVMNVNSASNNAKGAAEMMKLIDLTILHALKQDPNMNGLNFSTTETFGKIIMEKMVSQTGEYQNAIDGFFRKGYKLELLLHGIDPRLIKNVKSKAPRVRDEKAKAEADEINQRVWLGDYNQGLIGQQTLARLRGYDKPDQEGPRTNASGTNEEDHEKETQDEEDEESNMSSRFRVLTEYQYEIPTSCNDHDEISFAKVLPGNKGDLYRKYLKDSLKHFSNAIDSVSDIVIDNLSKLDILPSKSETAKLVFDTILNNWETQYIANQDITTSNYIPQLWDQFRKDKSCFGVKTNSFAENFEIPDAVFDMDDFRAMQYFTDSDQLYLGKFINDKATKKRLYQFIFDEHVNGSIPIGEDPSAKFKNKFKDLLNGESYKISRIIDTTANRIRNNSAIYYMDQAGVEDYRINEINDNLTCEHCSVMDGKKFEVGKTKSKLKDVMESKPEDVSIKSPFATTIGIDELRGMTTKEMEKAGIDVPTYHPKCRGFVTAVL